jgi:hypothetical protein
MSERDTYTAYAADCVRLAKNSQDTQTKAVLLGIAQAWIRLGDMVRAQLTASEAPLIPDASGALAACGPDLPESDAPDTARG